MKTIHLESIATSLLLAFQYVSAMAPADVCEQMKRPIPLDSDGDLEITFRDGAVFGAAETEDNIEVTIQNLWENATAISISHFVDSASSQCDAQINIAESDIFTASVACFDSLAAFKLLVYTTEAISDEKCEECETPSANDLGVVQYYFEIPCVPACELEISDAPSDTPSEAPTGDGNSGGGYAAPTLSIPTLEPPTPEPPTVANLPSPEPPTPQSPTVADSPTAEPPTALELTTPVPPTVAEPPTPKPPTPGLPIATELPMPESPAPAPPTIAEAPTPESTTKSAAPTEPEKNCPEDIMLLRPGDMEDTYPDIPIRIVEQTGDTVRFRVKNIYGSTISNVYTRFNEDFNVQHCYETQGLEQEAYTEYTAHCVHFSDLALVDLWVVGQAGYNAGAKVPECCHPSSELDSNIIQYTFKVQCESKCPTSSKDVSPTRTRKLSSLSSSDLALQMEPSIAQRLRKRIASHTEEVLRQVGKQDGTMKNMFCSAEKYPCGNGNESMARVCHHLGSDEYESFCIAESDSDVLKASSSDYCGSCINIDHGHFLRQKAK